MNKVLLIILVTLFMTGCEQYKQYTNWQNAPERYHCTLDEMRIVENETTFCTQNTGYNSRYCYGTAIMRQCGLKQQYTEQYQRGNYK